MVVQSIGGVVLYPVLYRGCVDGFGKFGVPDSLFERWPVRAYLLSQVAE